MEKKNTKYLHNIIKRLLRVVNIKEKQCSIRSAIPFKKRLRGTSSKKYDSILATLLGWKKQVKIQSNINIGIE